MLFRYNTFEPDVLELISHSHYGYLADGRLSYLSHSGEIMDQLFYQSLTYDDRGRLEHLSTSRDGVPSVPRTYSYDDLNQLTQVENSGSDQEFDYDAAGNRRGETEPYNRVRNEGLSGFDYDAEGNVRGHWRYQPKVSVSLTSANTADSAPHDFFLDLHRVSVPGGLTLSGVGDIANIVVTVSLVGTTESHSLAGSVVRRTGTNVYDVTFEEVKFWFESGHSNAVLRVAISFPSLPNAVVQEGTVRLDQLTTYQAYTWDYHNRLRTATVYSVPPSDDPNPPAVVLSHITYEYDVLGNRIGKRIDGIPGDEARPVGGAIDHEEYYVAENGHLLLEYDAQRHLVRQNIYAQAVDQLLAVEDFSYSGQTRLSQRVVWTLPDYQGSITELYAEDASADSLEYDAFGSFSVTDGGDALATSVKARYTGREYDPETGLYYYRARYYDPLSGRFLSPDPLGFASGDTNLYRYVRNSPTNATDPTGQWAVIDDAIAIGGGAIIGVIGQGVGDLISRQYSGWEAYVGAAVGGAAAGETLLYTANPILAGMAGGAAGNLTTQGLRMATGRQESFNTTSLLVDAGLGGLGGLGGAAAGRVLGGASRGLNAGLSTVFRGASQQTICRIASPILGGVSGAAMGGTIAAIGGGVYGYMEGGWEGAWVGAAHGLRVGATTGAIMGTGQALIAPYICFTAGTPVHTAEGLKNIENLAVGQRTLTEETKEAVSQPGDDPTAVDPTTWRLVRLRTAKPASSDNLVDIELLRPLDWLRDNRVQHRGVIAFSLPELGVDGPADVLAIKPCPEIEPGHGRVITGTFTTARCEVLELRLSNGEVLEPTPPHRFFSETREKWVAAENIQIGECLRTASGQAITVEDIALKAGKHRVYNLEVEQEHQFYVGGSGVLAHNSYEEFVRGEYPPGMGAFEDVGGHHPLSKRAFAWAHEDEVMSIGKDYMVTNEWPHPQPLTQYQREGYQAFGQTGEPLSIFRMSAIEVEAMVRNQIPADYAKLAVSAAIWERISNGQITPKHIPWVGPNPGA